MREGGFIYKEQGVYSKWSPYLQLEKKNAFNWDIFKKYYNP